MLKTDQYAPAKGTTVTVQFSPHPEAYATKELDDVVTRIKAEETKPTVYCGSSNLALMGEQVTGDNLLTIQDADVAAVFAIEALLLVDHFNFLDSCVTAAPEKKLPTAMATRTQHATAAGLYLASSDKWTTPYFDNSDLKSLDRQIFA